MIVSSIYIVLSLLLSLCIQNCYSDETDFSKSQYKADKKSKCTDTPLPSIINGNIQRFNSEAEVTCKPGFKLVGSAKVICKYNQWDPIPKCVQEVDPAISFTCTLPTVEHAKVVKFTEYLAIVKCEEGYYVSSYDLLSNSVPEYYITCDDGIWKYEDGKGIKDSNLPRCSPVESFQTCVHPPKIPHAAIWIPDGLNFNQMYVNGQTVKYECKPGYDFADSWKDTLTCSNGHWEGEQPVCLKIETCAKPNNIRNGRWSIKQVPVNIATKTARNNFPVGSEVRYECYNGFNMVGPPVIVCLSDRQWSHHAPQCGIMETYCPSIDVPNGTCKCDNKYDLSFCEPFFTDIEVHCTCNHGYRYVGSGQPLRCTADGTWNSAVPTCVKDLYGSAQTERPYPSEASGKSDVISDSSEGTHMNTLAIVIATACSVLGVLLFIMVLMFFRRRKPRPRLYHQVAGAPPPYTRVHSNSLDEHDRVALIGYETAPRLPTYEEATRSHARVHRSDMRVSNDYRPLPHIPGTLRNSMHTGGPPHSPQHSTDSNRHSIITTSTINRDALSEMFGSIDTVNVSMSDASTSVTVDTLDSGTSRPSNGSERATAGSLSSSQENFTTEDAPLLENRDRNGEETAHDELEIRVEEDNKDQS